MNRDIQKFKDIFSDLTDPRIERRKRHSLQEILLLVICGSLSGIENWRDFSSFGQARIDFLRIYYPYAHGIPSKATLARVFASLNPVVFKKCFSEWVQLFEKIGKEVVAIDGKCLRRSFDKDEGKSAIHQVSAYATSRRLVLGQQKTEEKSNEITTVPLLLALISLKDTICTMDAMGCMKSHAEQIIEGEGDYIFALKGNQGNLHKEVIASFDEFVENGEEFSYEEWDKGHGRIEHRKCTVLTNLSKIVQSKDWMGLKTIVKIVESREFKDGKKTEATRYFISSLEADAKIIAQSIRAHWAIENNLHYILDVVFNEDQSRVRKLHAAENMSIVKHIALNMINQIAPHFKDSSIKSIRKQLSWNPETLRRALEHSF
jgi:predicted transposase YbfD/YdcC